MNKGRNVYSGVAYPTVGCGKLQIDDIGFEEKKTITDMVLSPLRSRGKLVDTLAPFVILMY